MGGGLLMKIIEIIESKYWFNKKTNQSASIFGAIPWTNEMSRQDWELVSRGFTWRLDNGTTGLGRMPVKTREEAEKIMNEFNKLQESYYV